MLNWYRRRPCQRISILVPLGGDDPTRALNWSWLARYYRSHLNNTEIVIGTDRSSCRHWLWRRRPLPFSKAAAINNAFKKSHGDILVLLDSDAYLSAAVIQHCADRLRIQRRSHVRSWFVPYSRLYRLTRHATDRLVESDPCRPLAISDPPPPRDVDGRDGSGPLNVFGALCQIMPREAFVTVGGMNPKFRGWGGEDKSFLHAVDELWGPHRNTPNDILHLWHPSFTTGQGPLWLQKMWPGQSSPGINNALAAQYQRAIGNPEEMRRLQNEGR